jgi:hypothetical protein
MRAMFKEQTRAIEASSEKTNREFRESLALLGDRIGRVETVQEDGSESARAQAQHTTDTEGVAYADGVPRQLWVKVTAPDGTPRTEREIEVMREEARQKAKA